MEQKSQPPLNQELPDADWERTPASVKRLVESQAERLKQQELELAQLKQQLGEVQGKIAILTEQKKQNSSNSSTPPSTDLPNAPKRQQKRKSGRKRGGQPGHQGHSRLLYAIEDCVSVTDCYPEKCRCCGEKMQGVDPQPYRHQVVELPPVTPQVEEYRLHQLVCPSCRSATSAELPASMPPSGYGARVVAMVGVLSGAYRHSCRMVQSAMQDLFGVWMSVGTVNNLRAEASAAVATPVAEARAYVQSQPVVGADETGFPQGNADGGNFKGSRAWLWVAVTPLVTCFCVFLSRASTAAQSLLGENFDGILISDRWGGYNWLPRERRQLCWAHLKREFTKIAERAGVSRTLGEALLEQERQLFEFWYRVRDGTLARAEFIELVRPIRERVLALLEEGASHQIGSKEKTPLAQTTRTCRQLLKVEPALWLFVNTEGVEPTNNAAERAIRPAVLWRRTSFGSQSQAGSIFVARMLTVVTTVRSQGRNVLEYMTAACRAARSGQPAPSLLPETAASPDHILPAA